MLKRTPPVNAPYNELLTGLDVIAQVPDSHPTKYQYSHPATEPKAKPVNSNLYLVNSTFIYTTNVAIESSLLRNNCWITCIF